MDNYPRDWSQIVLPTAMPRPSRLLAVLITLVTITFLANAALAWGVVEAAVRIASSSY